MSCDLYTGYGNNCDGQGGVWGGNERGLPHPDAQQGEEEYEYRIPGNFQGRKLANFADLGPFTKVFSTNLEGRAHVPHPHAIDSRKFSP